MNSSLLPTFVIFGIDFVLFPFQVDRVSYIDNPDGEIVNEMREVLQYLPEVPAVLKKLNETGIRIAVSDFFVYSYLFDKLDKKLNWKKYFSYVELESPVIFNDIKKIQKQFNTTPKEMILFHNDPYIVETAKKEFDIFSTCVPNGMNMKYLDDSLRDYRLKKHEIKKP